MKENSTIKTYRDYIPAVKEKFPEISEHDINIILSYGFKMLYLCNLAGCDTLIVSQTNKFWFYIGELKKSSVRHFEYYRRKLFRKFRFLYRRIKPEWDGWYYTYLTEEEYKQIQPKRGRPKKKITLNKKFSFKLLDACSLRYPHKGYIIKYKYPLDMGFNFYLSTLICYQPEVVLIRDKSIKFKDILVSNNNYNYYEKRNN